MTEKIRLLYDAAYICNILDKNAHRSGIFFVAYNVLLQLLKHDEFDIWLYGGGDEVRLAEVIKNYKEFADCKIYKSTFLEKQVNFWGDLKYKNKVNKQSKIMRLLIIIIWNITRKINELYLKLNYKNLYNDIDVYFSPAKAVPNVILKKKNIKRYTILHDLIPLISGTRKGASQKWLFKLVDSINKNDYYFANSEFTKSDFIKYVPAINPDNINVIPLSTGMNYEKINDEKVINKVKEKYKIPFDKKYVFSLCNLDPRKNLVFAVKNFLKFTEKNNLDDFVIVLGGSGWKDFLPMLEKEISNLGEKQNKIIRIGYVDDEDMSALYSGAEMFVCPSLYEGFGIPVLEAMKCGLPVICSNVTSLPEVIEDCGIQINPHSDDELIAALEKMYYDRNFRAECIDKGLKRAELFSWEACCKVITDKIKSDMSL